MKTPNTHIQKLSQISQTSPKLSPSKKLKPRIISFKISLSLKRTPISFSFFFFNFLIQCNSPSLLGSPSNDFTIYQETSPYIGRVGSYISFKEAIVRKITCFIHYNAPAQYQKKNKRSDFLRATHVTPPSYPTPLYHTLCKISLPLGQVPCFFYLTLKHNCRHIHIHTPLSLTLSLVLILHHLHHLFTARSPGNSLGISNTSSSLLFKIKFLIFLVGLYTFARGIRYLSFDNNTHVIYELWK